MLQGDETCRLLHTDNEDMHGSLIFYTYTQALLVEAGQIEVQVRY